MRKKTVIFDVRCLQDVAYRDRGVGRLGANLVRSARDMIGRSGPVHLIAIADPELPELQQRFVDHFDEIRLNGYVGKLSEPTWFVELSPMTHDPLFVARILNCRDVFKVSVVYDFIPLWMPDHYLPTLAQKIDYQTKLSWLGQYDHFFPISNHTSSELTRVVGIGQSRISVTAAPIDAAFLAADEASAATRSGHVLVAGGGDLRKNVECAVRAHAVSRHCQELRVPLIITGGYPEYWRASLRDLYASHSGVPDLLSFLSHVPDDELAALYRNAACVVVPSRAEGFSIPVVEAMAVGTVVFSSSIPTHCELVENPQLMFEPDDHVRLAELLDSALTDTGFRESAIEHLSNRWQKFRADDIGHSFWRDVEQRAPAGLAAPLVGGQRPRIAVLSPLPPDRSGVADYTAASLKELSKFAEIHAFTAAKSPRLPDGATVVAPMSAFPHLSNRFDRVISVMGNSHFHAEIFSMLMRYGGACIEHDNRLLGFYQHLVGDQRGRRIAERELGRPLEPGEFERWLGDEATLEATFFAEIADRSKPLCVHSRESARLVRERFGVNASYLPFSVYREWHEEQFTPANRARARARVGFSPEEIAIITLGYVGLQKAPEECIWALDLMRGWGIPAKLHFVGEVSTDRARLDWLCEHLGLTSHVRFISDYVSEETYRDYLLAADAAVQLRTHLLGGLSGALLDCIAVGLPTVANRDLAESMEAPNYVFQVPDRPSPVLVAEALVAALESRTALRQRDEARAAYCNVHNFRVYAEELCAALSLEIARSKAA